MDPTTDKSRVPRSDFYDEIDVKQKHPPNVVDHRPNGGPLLSLLWSKEPLTGQTLFLGGEVGVDGRIYCIPGHNPRVLVIDPETDEVTQIGPKELDSNGTKFKWLRGIPVGDVIYGLPCHASEGKNRGFRHSRLIQHFHLACKRVLTVILPNFQTL